MAGLKVLSIPVDQSGESTRLVRWSFFLVFVLFGGAMAWASVAPIGGAVVATGIIKVDTNRKAIQHLEGGIISEILVHEGEEIAAGQALVILDDTDSSAELNILNDALNGYKVKESRLLAEASLAESVVIPNELMDDESEKTKTLIRNELALFNAKRKTLLDQVDLINEEIVHAEEAVTNLEGQIKSADSGLAIVREQLNMVQRLVEKKAIDKNSILELKRKVSAQKESLWAQKADLAERRQSASSLKLKIVNLRNDYAKNAEDELKENRKKIYEAQERIRPVLDALRRKTIRSSSAGQVINLQATTIGGVLKPGDLVAEIVPKERSLVFDLRIRPSDSDSVYVGQPAKIQISAYNQRTTPMIDGVLTYVSGDALEEKKGQEDDLFFRAYAKSSPEQLELLGDKTVSPGMPVTAFLQTGARTSIEYILSPIIAGMRKAMVEDVK